jgi:hypothetical protein
MERIGIHLPFAGVICVGGTQTIAIDDQWRPSITTKRTLVFLEVPDAGDLRDTYGLGSAQSVSSVIYSSPDAVELAREQKSSGRVTLYWWPRDPIALYTLYEHENGWAPAVTFDRSALCLEFQCDMRTGAFTIECLAPTQFETAVLFRQPRWPRRPTERTIVSHALKLLKTAPEAPRILEEGRRIACDIRAPKAGERYLFVVFLKCGIADCERWLEETSILGRAKRLFDSWAHAIGG